MKIPYFIYLWLIKAKFFYDAMWVLSYQCHAIETFLTLLVFVMGIHQPLVIFSQKGTMMHSFDIFYDVEQAVEQSIELLVIWYTMMRMWWIWNLYIFFVGSIVGYWTNSWVAGDLKHHDLHTLQHALVIKEVSPWETCL